jgi:hypothetical protein
MATFSSLGSSRPPDFGYGARSKRTGALWKWSLAITLAVSIFYAWQCGSAFVNGRALADTAVREFHEEFNQGRYQDILSGANKDFSGQVTNNEDPVKFFSGLHAKLGDAGPGTLVSMKIDVGSGATLIVCEYNTNFADGSAVETFTWKKTGDRLTLYGYNVESSAIL